MQANVKVTGSGHDPHLDGAIDIRGGSFAVPDLGTKYTGLDTRIDLKPEAVTVSEMRIVDDHAHLRTVGGTIAVHEGEVGAVDVKVDSHHFEVIHNKLARMNLDTAIRVTGELRKPRIVGSVDVDAGTIDVAKVLEEATSDPYSTEAASTDLSKAAEPAPGSSFQGLYDAVDLELGVGVP